MIHLNLMVFLDLMHSHLERSTREIEGLLDGRRFSISRERILNKIGKTSAYGNDKLSWIVSSINIHWNG